VDPDEVTFDGDKVSITYSDSHMMLQPDSPRWAKREKAPIYRFTAPQIRLIDVWAMRHLFICTSMFYANCHCDQERARLKVWATAIDEVAFVTSFPSEDC